MRPFFIAVFFEYRSWLMYNEEKKGAIAMELRVLNYFLRVAREESITKAAESLHITQPTLSRQLSALEDELGVALLDRSGRKISLTPEGILLRRRAEEIMALVDKTGQEISEEEGKMEGTISVAGGLLRANQEFIRLMKEFQSLHPHVVFDYFTGITDQISERMDQGLTDIGLLVSPFDVEKYDYVPIGQGARWGIYMRTDDPLSEKDHIEAADLKNKSLIMPSRKKLISELSTWMGGVLHTVRVPAVCSLPDNATIMVEQGMGYYFSNDGGVPFLDERAITFRPLHPSLFITTVLAWRRNQPFGRPATAFISFLKDKLGHPDA